MESAQELLKKKGGAGPGASGPARADVFDTVGNEGLKAHLEETQANVVAEQEEPSMLALVEAETASPETVESETVVEEIVEPEVVEEVLEEEDPAVAVEEVEAEEEVPAEIVAEEVVAPEVVEEEQPAIAAQVAEEEQPVVAVEIEEPEVEDLVEPEEVPESEVASEAEAEKEVEKAEVIAEEVEPEKAPALAVMAGVDPVLVTDPKELGETEEAKEKALGAEGREDVEEAIAKAVAELGGEELDDNGLSMVTERLTEQLDMDEIVGARRENRLEDLVHEALRGNAIEARDEVISVLQQALQDPHTLQKLAGSGDVGVALIEHLAVHVPEVEDLVALAAYDHADLQKKVLLTDEALHVTDELSPVALRMGGFAAVLYQMVANELLAHPMPEAALGEGEAPATAGPPDPVRLEVLRRDLLAVNNQLRLSRTAG